MNRTAIAALLALAAQPALAADAPWKAAWYQVEIFPEVKYAEDNYGDRAACEAGLVPSRDRLVVCAHLTKPADALDAAIAAFGDAVKKEPKNAPVIMQRGNLYMEKGDTTRAIADYTRAMKLTQDDFWPYALRASAYEKSGKRAKAVADYRAALARHPDADMAKQVHDALKKLGAET